eukprot:4300093-Heterocapsa_arctica.AAC.1
MSVIFIIFLNPLLLVLLVLSCLLGIILVLLQLFLCCELCVPLVVLVEAGLVFARLLEVSVSFLLFLLLLVGVRRVVRLLPCFSQYLFHDVLGVDGLLQIILHHLAAGIRQLVDLVFERVDGSLELAV